MSFHYTFDYYAQYSIKKAGLTSKVLLVSFILKPNVMRGQTTLLGEKLAQLRIVRGLTQQQLANQAGVSLSTVSKLEEGSVTKPSARILLKLTGVLDYNLDDLLSGEPLPAHLRQKPHKTQSLTDKPTIKFVYFDVGGVLVHTESLILHRLSAGVNRPIDQVKAVYYRYISLVHRNKLTPGDLKLLMLLKLSIPFSGKGRQALFRDWADYTEPNLPTQQFATEISKRYPIGLISNIGDGGFEGLKRLGVIPKLAYKAVVLSCEVGAIKPEAAMFAIAAAKAGVEPRHILLIDDRKENVLGARAAGWQATWFKEVKTAESITRIRRQYF